jgi:chaperonin GroEL (HSP60 family)
MVPRPLEALKSPPTRTSRPASTSSAKALQAPVRQIAENAGVDGSIVGKLLEQK